MSMTRPGVPRRWFRRALGIPAVILTAPRRRCGVCGCPATTAETCGTCTSWAVYERVRRLGATSSDRLLGERGEIKMRSRAQVEGMMSRAMCDA